MRICVVGAGAIGGLFAAHLAQLPDVEVWAFDSSPDHVAAINADGLRVTGHVELNGRVQARTDPAEIPACPLGIVAVKGTVTEAAIEAAAPIFADGAVCSVQNGIGNEEVIAEHVPRVIRGVTLPAGHVVAPGVIHMVGPGPTWIGPFEPMPAGREEIERLGNSLNESGLETRVRVDARGAQWTKLLFNACTNPLCALTGLTHGELCDYPPTIHLVDELLREGQAVAGALGIELEDDPAELVYSAGKANYHHRPSMLQDVAARRPTEIATLNGGIVRAADEVGVPVPLHRAVVDLIRGVELSWSPR
ncbi:MAG TPA: 2-dehydropantoate 2-reductase [Solirubrobacteraceae bacterium]|nr:2-dehydropantoate 2-reductase [Solirubrobacteraceae bacterium]